MVRLFPPVGSVTWKSPHYPRAVAESASGDGRGVLGLTHVQVWEPVIRHVALALCGLEDTGTTGSSPHLRLETLARLTGTWVTVLNIILGGEFPRVAGPIR
jgi:hypothetical protein